MPHLEGGSGGSVGEVGPLRERFLRAVEEASRELRIPIARDPPERVTLAPLRVERGYRSGVSEVPGGLAFSSLLPQRRLEQALRREAAIFLIPRDMLEVEEIQDLAWAYAGADRSWWRECTRVRWGLPMPPYDAPSLFSGLDRGEAVAVVRSTLRTLLRRARSGSRLDFFSYYTVLLASLGRLDPPRLAESQKRVLQALSRNPYLSRGELKEETGLSPASVSRAVRHLTSAGLISGPQQVNYLALGLSSVVVSAPRGEARLRQILREFPLTWSVFEPLNPADPEQFVLLFPRSGLHALAGALRGRARVYQIVRQSFSVNFTSPSCREAMEALVEGLESPAPLSGWEAALKPVEGAPRVKLDSKDFRILEMVSREGRVSASLARRAGVPGADGRIRKLRSAGILADFYTIGGMGLGEPLLMEVETPEPEEDYGRLSRALPRVGSALVARVRGDLDGVWAIAYVDPASAVRVARALRLVLGERLRMLSPAAAAPGSSFRLPPEIWDEGRQEFRVGELVARLAGG